MKVLAVVPARGGSRGVPRKNVRELAGKPLVAYTIEAALRSRSINRVVLSTDDDEIAEVGRQFGADVPFLRPAELAQDDTPTLPVVLHAMSSVERAGEHYDAVCLLQPTNPFRRPELIDECVQALEGADAVVSVLRVPHEYNPHWVYFMTEDGRLQLATGETEPITRRQALPPAYHREGSVYVTRWDVIKNHGTLYGARLVGVETDPLRSVNIDTEDDWLRAEDMIKRRGRPEQWAERPL